MICLEELQKKIGYRFKDPALLKEALTHKSYAFEKKTVDLDNQRMEFFGDAILEMIASKYVYHKYRQSEEGELTKIRSAMTRGEALYELAKKIDLGRYLYLGKGEQRLKGKNQKTRVIDAFEALIAALYLDSGFDVVEEFYLHLVAESWHDPYQLMISQNPKGNLQELVQKRFNQCPEYILKNVSGQEHDPTFEVEVYIKNNLAGTGSASSRKGAEEAAARQAYSSLIELEKQGKKSL